MQEITKNNIFHQVDLSLRKSVNDIMKEMKKYGKELSNLKKFLEELLNSVF